MADIQDVVRVTARLATAGIPRVEFGRTMFVYNATEAVSATAPTLASIQDLARQIAPQVYSSQTGVAVAFDSADAAYMAGAVYFQQIPFPRNLLTAARFTAGARAFIWGGAPDETALKAITSGMATLDVAGESFTIDISAVTGSGDAYFTAVAVIVQTGLRGTTAVSDLTSVVYSGGRFVVIIGATTGIGALDDLDIITEPLGGANVAPFGLGDTATFFAGAPSLTMADNLDRIRGANDSWTYLTVEPAIENSDTDAKAAASWAASQRGVHFFLANVDADVFTETAASTLRDLRGLGNTKTAGIYNDTRSYDAVSMAARISSVDFDGSNTVITLNFKQLPGVPGPKLSTTQIETLRGLSINYLQNRLNTDVLHQGTTFGTGTQFIDTSVYLDWFENAVQTEIFNLLLRAGAIPNTLEGVRQIHNTISRVCEQARQNGGIAGRRVSESMAGEIRTVTRQNQFDGVLNNGYLVYAPDVGTLTQTQRDERQTVGFNVWLAISGAVHSVDVSIVFES